MTLISASELCLHSADDDEVADRIALLSPQCRYISFNHEFYWAVNRQSSGESDRGRAMEARGASEAQREKGDDEKGKKSAEDPDPQVLQTSICYKPRDIFACHGDFLQK